MSRFDSYFFLSTSFSWVHESVVSSYTPEEADYLIVDQEGNVVKMVEKTRTAKNTSRPSALNNQSSFNTLSVTESNLDITSEQTMNRTAQQHSMIRPQSDLFSGRKFYLLDKDSRAELASLISLHKGQVVDHISKTEYVISKNPVISSLPSNTEHINLRTVSWLRDSVEKDVILQPAFQVKFGILFFFRFSTGNFIDLLF